jgi:putative SOS response-associated peptidase YedK
MCYRIACNTSAKKIESRFKATFLNPADHQPVYHVASFASPKWTVITQQAPDKINTYIWGLIPEWAKDENQAIELQSGNANAKSETVFEKPSFKYSIETRRCLVISTGFFEFQEVNGKKYPYFISLSESEIFSMAGIYATWTDKSTGEIFDSFSILTKEADAFMANIHNSKKRMPVILPESEEKNWLNPDLTNTEIKSFFRDFDLSLTAHTVSHLLTSRTQNSDVPEVQEAFLYPETMSMH